ncbi:MAG: hypothetical protein KDE26_17250 [Bacteroidetes bacterium]|nr:hypothetical protein [Bacteroidota bacterium]
MLSLEFLQSVSPILLAVSAAVSATVAIFAYRHSRKDQKHDAHTKSITKAKDLIAKNQVKQALEHLLPTIQDSSAEKDLILLKQQWIDFERRRDLGMIKDKHVPVISARLISRILLALEKIEKSPERV